MLSNFRLTVSKAHFVQIIQIGHSYTLGLYLLLIDCLGHIVHEQEAIDPMADSPAEFLSGMLVPCLLLSAPYLHFRQLLLQAQAQLLQMNCSMSATMLKPAKPNRMYRALEVWRKHQPASPWPYCQHFCAPCCKLLQH